MSSYIRIKSEILKAHVEDWIPENYDKRNTKWKRAIKETQEIPRFKWSWKQFKKVQYFLSESQAIDTLSEYIGFGIGSTYYDIWCGFSNRKEKAKQLLTLCSNAEEVYLTAKDAVFIGLKIESNKLNVDYFNE